MEAREKDIRIYETADGRVPFSEWMEQLEGQQIYGVVMNRIDRVGAGLFGDCEPVGEGLSELRIDFGPGYRVYFGQMKDIVILLCGGIKQTQAADIKLAKQFWRAFNAE